MLQGTIDEFPLIDVLGILQARNKTGRLEIERQAGRGLIYVRLGEPYYAESSLTRSLIGQKLVDIGAITDMQLRKALDRQAESGERLGQILLTHGVISADHVAQAVISQIKDALADLLAWEAGEFRWETGAEVEVEVPLFGASPGASGEGANPLAPHVIPITNKEPDTGPDSAEPEAVVADTDFPHGGTTMTTNEVTALPNESIPDAGQDASYENLTSTPELDDVAPEVTEDDTEQETDPQPVNEFDAQIQDESDLDDETEQVAEDESDDDDETEQVAEDESDHDDETEQVAEDESDDDDETEQVAEDESDDDDETEQVAEDESDDDDETEQVAEDESDDDDETEQVAEDESDDDDETEQVAEDESDDDDETEQVAEDESDDDDETEQVAEDESDDDDETEQVAEDESDDDDETEPESVHGFHAETDPNLSPLTLQSEARVEMPEQFHVPRIIRSAPAPELDEEFEAVFEATSHASFEVEPVAEPVEETPSFDLPPAVDPVFGADAFTPIGPVTEFGHVTFDPRNGSSDPVFDHGNFEPLPEGADPVSFEPVAESVEENSEASFESVTEDADEDSESSFEQVAETEDEHAESAFEPTSESVDEASESTFEASGETHDDYYSESFEPVAEEVDEHAVSFEPVAESVDEYAASFEPVAEEVDEHAASFEPVAEERGRILRVPRAGCRGGRRARGVLRAGCRERGRILRVPRAGCREVDEHSCPSSRLPRAWTNTPSPSSRLPRAWSMPIPP